MAADDESTTLVPGNSAGVPAVAADEPPVVARLVIEIRSDGSHSIARGRIEMQDAEDAAPEWAAVEARGDSPLGLAMTLLRSLGSMGGLGASLGEPKPEKPGLFSGGVLGAIRALLPTKRLK